VFEEVAPVLEYGSAKTAHFYAAGHMGGGKGVIIESLKARLSR